MADFQVPYTDDEDDQTPGQALASLVAPADPASLVLPPAATPNVALAPQSATAADVLSRVQTPTYDPNKVAQMRAQANADNTPTNPYEAQYRPTTGQKIRRGLAAFFSNGIPGALTADYAAPNKMYSVAEAQRQARLQGDNAALSDYQTGFEDQSKAATANTDLGKAIDTANVNSAKGQYYQARADKYDSSIDPATLAPDDPEHPEAGWHGSTYGGETKTGLTAPGGKGQTPETVASGRQVLADKYGLKGLSRAEFILTGKINPKYMAGGGGGAGAGTGGGSSRPSVPQKPDGTPDLSSIPASIRATVQQIGEGRVPAPRRTKQNAAILDAVANAYPDYDASMYPTYAKTRQDFTSGTESRAINSFNTALSHLGRAEQNAPKNGSFPLLNRIENAASRATGSSKLTPFDTDRTAVSSEIAKAYKGGVINKEEHDEYQALLNPDASPAQMKANFAELKGLLSGKLKSYDKQWTDSMPKGAVKPFKVMSDDASAVMNEGKAPSGNDMITVQIPGQAPGRIHSSQLAAFKVKYPNAVQVQ